MKRHNRMFWLVCLFLLLAGSAHASFNIWTFRGVITNGPPTGPFQPGIPYSMEFAVNIPPVETSPGLYFSTIGYTFNANRSAVSASSSGSGVWIVNNRATPEGKFLDGIIFSMFGERNTGFPAGVLFDGSEDGITLASTSDQPSPTPFSDTSFPSTLDLNAFPNRYMTLRFDDGSVKATVDSLYLNGVLISEVPEPTTVSLIFAVAGLLACRRHARVRRCFNRAS